MEKWCADLMAYFVIHAKYIPDFINGSFEALGSLFILNHCLALWKSRQARGVSLVSTIFFQSWGIWNIFYYPHLDQMISFYGGIAIFIANTVWIGLIIWVRSKEIK
jgi:uncharacterized membrane protein YfcA